MSVGNITNIYRFDAQHDTLNDVLSYWEQLINYKVPTRWQPLSGEQRATQTTFTPLLSSPLPKVSLMTQVHSTVPTFSLLPLPLGTSQTCLLSPHFRLLGPQRPLYSHKTNPFQNLQGSQRI